MQLSKQHLRDTCHGFKVRTGFHLEKAFMKINDNQPIFYIQFFRIEPFEFNAVTMIEALSIWSINFM